MLWSHSQAAITVNDDANADAVLGAAVVILTLSDLTEAAEAVQALVTEQGGHGLDTCFYKQPNVLMQPMLWGHLSLSKVDTALTPVFTNSQMF